MLCQRLLCNVNRLQAPLRPLSPSLPPSPRSPQGVAEPRAALPGCPAASRPRPVLRIGVCVSLRPSQVIPPSLSVSAVCPLCLRLYSCPENRFISAGSLGSIYVCVCTLSCFSCVRLCVTPRTIVCQAPLCIGLSRQEYWSGLPCPPPGDLPHLGTEPPSLMSPALTGRFLTTSAIWEVPQIPYIWISRYMDSIYILDLFFSF